jgi:asparagine synthase (glutamine-hydrolysing)
VLLKAEDGTSMCGICGIVHTQASEPVSAELLRQMNDTMVHRGPDGSGEFLGPGVGLAMRRLAVVDLAGGQQPMYNEDRSVVVVYNGEIYNQGDLRKRLAGRGHQLHTTCDTEVIAHLYEDEGDRFPLLLNGMFGIALWDIKKRRLVLVRDRLGIKPLYFAQVGDKLAFSSELRALLAHPAIDRDLDMMGLSEYLTFQHTMPPRTMLKHVQKLPPGHIAVFENGTLTLREYWDMRFKNDIRDAGEDFYIDRFGELFAKSVERQLMSDVPLGVFLSGGIDSSAIVAMMSRLGVSKEHTYSLGYPLGDVYGELSHAQLVSKTFHTQHDELIVSAQDYAATLPRFVEYMDEPVSDSVSILFMMLAKRAREDVTVVLSGQGADETLGGYRLEVFQSRFDRIRRFQRIPRFLRYSLPALMEPALPQTTRDWLARGNSDLSHIVAKDAHTLAWQFEADEKRRLCPSLQDVPDHCSDIVRDTYRRSGARDPLHQILYVYSKIVLAENLLMHGDRMTMAHSLEMRVPFLDHELIDFVTEVPSKYLIYREADGTYTTKNLLKKAMRDHVPRAVLERPKVAFPIPLDEWYQDQLADHNRQVLLSEAARTSGYYDMAEMEKLVDRHVVAPSRSSALQIKNLLFFEMWRQWILKIPKRDGAIPRL